MKYRISRTSVYGEKPCEEAIEGKCLRVDTRTCTEEDFNRRLAQSGKWRERGINHRVLENGYIARDFEHTDWFVQTDDLLAFSRKYGELVLSAESDAKDCPDLEIYDSWRE